MSQTVQLFQKDDLAQVSRFGNRENPLFCLKDVCKILEDTTPIRIQDSIINEFGDELNQIYLITDTLGRLHGKDLVHIMIS